MASAEDPFEVLPVGELTPGARRILDVAGELFYRRGIHAVGVDVIAAESGITKRTLYDRFGSKDKLVATYLRDRHHRWWGRMEQRLDAEPSSPVLAVFDSYFADAEPSNRGCAFLNAAGELPFGHPGYEVVRAHKQAVRQRIAALLRAHHPALYAEADGVADEIFLLLEGAIAHRGIDSDDRLLAQARSTTARLLDVRSPSD